MDINLNRTAVTFLLALVFADVSSAQTQNITALFFPFLDHRGANL